MFLYQRANARPVGIDTPRGDPMYPALHMYPSILFLAAVLPFTPWIALRFSGKRDEAIVTRAWNLPNRRLDAPARQRAGGAL